MPSLSALKSVKCFVFGAVVRLHKLHIKSVKTWLLREYLVLKQSLFHMMTVSLHLLNHVVLFCWKVSIVTHAQCFIGYGLHLRRPRTQNNAPLGTSSTLVRREWVCAGHPNPRRNVCFVSRRTCCDISPGDNMLIYSAAGEAKCNAPPPSRHTRSFNGLHQSPCYQQISPRAPTYKGVLHSTVYSRPALDTITSDAIYYHTDFYLLSHSPFSAFLHHSGPARSSAEELYSNQTTLHVI